MAQFRPDQTPPPQAPKGPRQTGSWIRLALLAGLGLYFAILLVQLFGTRLGGPARVDLSYSQLVTQVENGNVSDITIQGQSAQGDLRAAVSNNGTSSTPAPPRPPFTMSPASSRRSSSCKRWSISSATRANSRSLAAGCPRACC